MIRIIVPIGGEGRSFAEKGYTFPKPLIEIAGQPMVDIVVRNLTPCESHEFIFVCRQEHVDKFALRDVLGLIAPKCKVVVMRGRTAGALCSVLLAAEYLESDEELLVANADQYIDLSIDLFLDEARTKGVDGSIMTFPSTHPKWSYARVEEGQVVAVAEKRPISHHATVGLYYFRRGADFFAAAEQMLVKNAAVSGEFYVCPVYNELILMGKRISIYPIARDQMYSLGTPEDVESFSKSKARDLTW